MEMKIKKEIKRIVINMLYLYECYIKREYDHIKGHGFINKPMNNEQYEMFIKELYGNKYIEKKYTHDEDIQMEFKRWLVNLILNNLQIKSMCDAGANRGYLMKAFYEKGIKVCGFDILDNLDEVLPEMREYYKLGSILDIPDFFKGGGASFDLVTSTDVFEHIPINLINTMVIELKKMDPKYFVFMISKDMFNEGHITLKGTNWWVKKFKPEYRMMKELSKNLNKVKLRGEEYRYTGIPRNGFNKVPGIIFLEKCDQRHIRT